MKLERQRGKMTRTRKLKRWRKRKPQTQKQKGCIYYIFRGFRGRGTINSSRKDFEGIQPHEDDPIVVMLKIADYEIEGVLLDQGSSADLIYWDAFEKLGLTEADLSPYDGALVGSLGERVFVRGFVELNTVFGEGKSTESFAIKFLVVKCTSPYNVLIRVPL